MTWILWIFLLITPAPRRAVPWQPVADGDVIVRPAPSARWR